MKKTWILLVFIMLCAGCLHSALADSILESGDYLYTVEGDGARIILYQGGETDVLIPGELDGVPVTSIGAFAFERKTWIQSVVISDGVEVIEDMAFLACLNLKTVTLPDSLDMIMNNAFQNCKSLTEIRIPASTRFLFGNPFSGCESLTAAYIPSLTNIDGDLFEGCSNLTVYTDKEGYVTFYLQDSDIPVQIMPELFENASADAVDPEFLSLLEAMYPYFDGFSQALYQTVQGMNGEAPFELMREALLTCGSAFRGYKTGAIREHTGTISFQKRPPSEAADRLCQMLGGYGRYNTNMEGWAKLAGYILPLLNDDRLDGDARVFTEDLYILCCAAGLTRHYSEDTKTKDMDAYYTEHIAPADDAIKKRILDVLSYKDSVLNPPADIIAVYAKDEKAHLVSNEFIEYAIWKEGMPRFWVMLTNLYKRDIAWEELFDRVEALQMLSNPQEYARECRQTLAYSLLQEATPFNLALLGNQFYDADLRITFADAEALTADMPVEMVRRLEAGAAGTEAMRPNYYVRWPSELLSGGLSGMGSGEGFILVSAKGNAYKGVPESELPPYESVKQCREVARLLDTELPLVLDPAEAKAALVFSCTYSDGKSYQSTTNNLSSVTAYNCVMNVRAVDLLTGREIASADFRNAWGSTITVSIGVGTIYHDIPDFYSEEFSEAALAFRQEVQNHLTVQ